MQKAVRKTASQWQELIRRYHNDTVSAEHFCEQHGLSLDRFHHWLTRIPAQPTPSNFIAVKSKPAPKQNHTSNGLRCLLNNGMTLEWSDSVKGSYIVDLLADLNDI